MNNVTGFNPENFFLGSLCRRGHDYQGTGKSLRFNNNACKDCKSYWDKKRQSDHAESIHYLGNLCRRGHNHQDSGMSLRYTISDSCVQCHTLHRESKEAHNERGRAYYRANTERTAKRVKAYRLANPEATKKRTRSWQLANPEKMRVGYARYRQAHPEKARAYTHLRKAKKRNCSYSNFSAAELKVRLAEFDGCCYCGQAKVDMHLDHFLPLASGGSHVLSNLVVACPSCNMRKSDRDPYEWFSGQPFFSQKRWKTILKLLGKTQSNYNQIPLL